MHECEQPMFHGLQTFKFWNDTILRFIKMLVQMYKKVQIWLTPTLENRIFDQQEQSNFSK